MSVTGFEELTGHLILHCDYLSSNEDYEDYYLPLPEIKDTLPGDKVKYLFILTRHDGEFFLIYYIQRGTIRYYKVYNIGVTISGAINYPVGYFYLTDISGKKNYHSRIKCSGINHHLQLTNIGQDIFKRELTLTIVRDVDI